MCLYKIDKPCEASMHKCSCNYKTYKECIAFLHDCRCYFGARLCKSDEYMYNRSHICSWEINPDECRAGIYRHNCVCHISKYSCRIHRPCTCKLNIDTCIARSHTCQCEFYGYRCKHYSHKFNY